MGSQFENFVSAIAAVGKEVRRIKAQEMRRFGLKGTDVMCLHYLEGAVGQGGLTASELSRQVGIDRAAVSRCVARLERQGLVGPEGEGAQRWGRRLSLTDKGLAVTREANQVILEVVGRACEGVSAQDRAAMYRALWAIHANLEGITS
ncbi:MarR family winged helix-turn-helix transcriptional regulator [Olsenella urininfantis]|uniref:MarR family winged helix-turn-helix transcriptional regulator n=1 Tax=Olsenella urininfantis TaxID=1871033 RepID=UPI00098650FE|nr:MarR family transcriptional regulator [Olsenella urininfantis]